MERMKIVIDGSKFSTLDGFYTEIDKLLTKNLNWQTGHNLDAFNDLLHGGFGAHDYGQPLEIHWLHSEKSRKDLSIIQNYFTKQTYFEIIVDIILDIDNSGHDCTLILDNKP